MEWINVKDKLPKTKTRILVIDSEFYYAIAYYTKSGGFKLDGLGSNINEDVTHWMHLPNPPD